MRTQIFQRFLRINISTYVIIFLAIRTCFYVVCQYSVNDHVNRDDVDMLLYKHALPSVWKHDRPNCTYESILGSTRTVHAWDARKRIHNFDPRGIVDGAYSPEHCNPLYSIAIIITYRNRLEQLNILLPYIHNFLRKQNIHYKIYVVEQNDDKPWNKGLLYNLGARQAMADQFQCLILHDADLLPLDDANLYACTVSPRHLSGRVDKFRFILPYDFLVGGVLAITSHQYNELNGFSNQFLGWGGEDDEFAGRILRNKLPIIRFPAEMSRYTMLQHRPSERNAARFSMVAERGRDSATADGLRSVAYSSLRYQNTPLFTLIRVQT